MSVDTPDEKSSIAARWAASREAARSAGLSVTYIAALAGVPTRTVNDMLQDGWKAKTFENMERVERAIAQALAEEKEKPRRAS